MARAQLPFARKGGDLNGLRERLLDTMWDDVGVIRDAAGLHRGLEKLDAIEAELLSIGVADGDRAFNLTWHDWLNLRSLVEISQGDCRWPRSSARTAAARTIARTFPARATSPPRPSPWRASSGGRLDIADEPVQFTIVKPGESLLKEAAE